MNADPKRKSHYDDLDRTRRARRRQEEALDDALKNTFPASDPVSIMVSARKGATKVDHHDDEGEADATVFGVSYVGVRSLTQATESRRWRENRRRSRP